MSESEQAVVTAIPGEEARNNLDFYVAARNGKKRNYIYSYGKSITCDHPEIRIVARGGVVYRCMDCNYAFHILGAFQQPLHNEVIQAAFTLAYFSKEFGNKSLQEVLRRPIGQMDGSPQKPVLPEGMSFQDVLKALEEIDVTGSLDEGREQLQELLETQWVGPKQRALAQTRERKMQLKRAQAEEAKALKAGKQEAS